jgi:hypothetical protein
MTASANIIRPAHPSRREFLNYAFGASMALALAGSCGGLAWFLQQQRFVGAAASGLFQHDLDELPFPQGAPVFVREAQAYLSNPGGGLIALLGQCPYERWLVRWSHTNWRFECPLCGSKFHMDGTYVEGSAARDLSKGILRVTTELGVVNTPPDGAPVLIEDVQSIVLDVKQPILGALRTYVGIGQIRE